VGDNHLYTPRKIRLRGSSYLLIDQLSHHEMNVETLKKFCKDTSRAFFNAFNLISY